MNYKWNGTEQKPNQAKPSQAHGHDDSGCSEWLTYKSQIEYSCLKPVCIGDKCKMSYGSM